MLSKNKLKQIRKLHRKKGRVEAGLTIAEGVKIVKELLRYAPDIIESIYITEEITDTEILKAVPEVVKEKDMREMSLLETAPGVLAIMRCHDQGPKNIPDKGIVLALDGIRDPGNMGTIIRTALWFDVVQVLCSEDCVELFSPKVVQASMGGVFRIQAGIKDLKDLPVYGLPVYGAVMDGESMYNLHFNDPMILVILSTGVFWINKDSNFLQLSPIS